MEYSSKSRPTPEPPARGPNPALGWLGGLLLTLTGCAVGPSFERSRLPQPPAAAIPPPAATGSAPGLLGEAQSFRPDGAVPERWWTGFGSPELDGRVALALAQSPTLAAARAALVRAQENLLAANGGRLPAVDLRAGVTRQNSLATGAVVSPFTVYNASVNVSYTLDLFGGVRRGIEFQQSLADQQRWLLQGAGLALAANVTTASIREAGLRGQLEAAEAVLAVLQEQAELIGKQVALGAKGPADLLAAQANVAAAQAALPGLRQQLEAVRNQIAVYLGRFPGEADLASLSLEAFSLPRELPVSLPSTLVRQRPDILAAEARVQGATAQAGLAAANLYPSLTLAGAYGPQATRAGDLLKSDLMVWNAGLNLLQPVFHGGSLRAQRRAADAGLDQAVAEYRTTLLNAFGDVTDVLDALRFDAETLQARVQAEQAAASSLVLARTQYRLGAASYLQLLDATRLWQQARSGLIQAQAARLADTTALYAALGGGWTSKTN